MLEPGDNLNGYLVKSLIGYGGFAEVYLVESKKFNRDFAAKVIPLYSKGRNEIANELFPEAKALSKLDHPNIIRLYDFFKLNSLFVLILEYCPGRSLDEEIKMNGPMKLDRFLKISLQIASAIECSHRNGSSHHDIKPHNILFDKYGRPQLADFGISIKLSALGVCNDYKCSIVYAPPEVINKEQYCPLKADIWSLGVTLAFLLQGKIPFEYSSKEELKMIISNGIIMINRNMGYDIDILIRSMLKKDPQQRPTAMSVMNFLEKTSKKFKIDNINKHKNLASVASKPMNIVIRPFIYKRKTELLRIISPPIHVRIPSKII